MNAPINRALHRYLVAHGATPEEALEAASLETSTLVTKADLAELKAELFKHTTSTLLTATGIYAGIVGLMLLLFAFVLRVMGVVAP